MLSFVYVDGRMVEVLSDRATGLNRNDMSSLNMAKVIAAEATTLTGRLHIGVDKGNHTWPRYDVIEAPVVGKEVSKAFNGDYYPCGEIVSVSKTLRVVTTSDGSRFYRRGESSTWLNNRTWALVPGTINRRNPSF